MRVVKSIVGLGVLVMAVGCSSKMVKKSEIVKAEKRFRTVEMSAKMLRSKMDVRLKKITDSKLKPSSKYAFRRQALLKLTSDARKVLKDYVDITASVPADKHPHEWVYASFTQGAFVSEEIARYARLLKRRYERASQKGAVEHFGKFERAYLKNAYRGYMSVLFLGYYYHKLAPKESTHTRAGNTWLGRSQRRRCLVSKKLGLKKVEHSNITWGMFDKVKSGYLGIDKSELRSQLMEFMKGKDVQHCE
ncbi:MAG: hypothetical protein CL920_26265 [Deltaproteobacteria bacterium]|nr:hypothetical protein [Deltaproteobacteria bacterium]